jgi:hypothetical protein
LERERRGNILVGFTSSISVSLLSLDSEESLDAESAFLTATFFAGLPIFASPSSSSSSLDDSEDPEDSELSLPSLAVGGGPLTGDISLAFDLAGEGCTVFAAFLAPLVTALRAAATVTLAFAPRPGLASDSESESESEAESESDSEESESESESESDEPALAGFLLVTCAAFGFSCSESSSLSEASEELEEAAFLGAVATAGYREVKSWSEAHSSSMYVLRKQ